MVYPAPAQPQTLQTVTLNETDYISINALAQAYKIRTYYRKETGKLVLYFPAGKVKIAAETSFLMLDEQTFQLPQPVILVEQELFVPLRPFMQFLKRTIWPELQYVISAAPSLSLTAKTEPAPPQATGPVVNLTSVTYEEKKNGLAIFIPSTRSFTDADFSYFFKGDKWFYLTILNGRCDSLQLSGIDPTASVERAEVINSGTSVQVALLLRQKFISADVHYDARTGRILISLFLPLDRNIKQKIEEAKSSWVIDTIVLDAGHGGKDPGAPGHWGLMNEKDIVLDIVLRLGKMLESHKNIKVIYTRTTDDFIPLWKRTEIANKSGGKLFLSFHVNANENTNLEGFELYLLRPGRSDDAIKVAEAENSVIQMETPEDMQKYEGFDEITNILANMVHSVNMRDSETLAEIVSKNFSAIVPQKNRGVKQAGFYVLVGASMPKLLCEVGYNTNKTEARKLNTKKHRQQIAESFYKSILQFKEMCDQTVSRND